jgi:membrane associated rhomboid family serine protease
MYSINVFLTFTLTMAGMFRHWWQEQTASPWLRRRRLALFGGAAILCGSILVVTVVAKFTVGGWVTVVATGLVVAAFLLVFGWLTRHLWQIAVSLVVMFIYGGVLLGAVPVLDRCGGVSWQGHLCGAIAGVLAAYWLSGPERQARLRRKAGQLPGPAS